MQGSSALKRPLLAPELRGPHYGYAGKASWTIAILTVLILGILASFCWGLHLLFSGEEHSGWKFLALTVGLCTAFCGALCLTKRIFEDEPVDEAEYAAMRRDMEDAQELRTIRQHLRAEFPEVSLGLHPPR